MAATIHTSSFTAIRRGTAALRRVAVTRSRLQLLRQVDHALEAGNARRARTLMDRLDVDLRVEQGLLPPRQHSEFMVRSAIAGAVLAGTALVMLVSCGGAAHAADGVVAAYSPTLIARMAIGGLLALAAPIAALEWLDRKVGFMRKHAIVAAVTEVAMMTTLLLTVVWL